MKKTLLLCLSLISFSFANSAIIPAAGVSYYVLQAATRSGKVVGATSFNESVIQEISNQSVQQFQFIPVSGKTDTYYLKNQAGFYLINSEDLASLTEYSNTPVAGNGEWILEGTSLNSIRLKVSSSAYLASADMNAGSYLYCDKTITDVLGVFSLVPASTLIQNGLIDPGFENAVVEGTPLGVWINDNNKILGNDDAATQIYRSRVINNGYQSVGNNAFLARFYGDDNSYTKISYQLKGLIKGATYQFTFKYKQSNANNTDAFVNSYISLIANAEPATALSNVSASVPPASITTTQSPGSATLTFYAPSTECYVVWQKNPAAATGRNFLFYIDDMALTKIKDPVEQVFEGQYFIQQRTSGKVIGKRADGTVALKYASKEENSQMINFVPVSGKDQVFYLKNNENQYLSKSTKNTNLLEFTNSVTDNTQYQAFSEWQIAGSSDSLVYISQASNAAMVIGSDSVMPNSTLLNNKSLGLSNSAFALQKVSQVLKSTYMFDPDFENSPLDGGPLGTWIPNNDPLQFGAYGFSRVQGYNGWASSGKKAFYLRFLGDVSSYNSISQQLFDLVPGATYRLDLQYKCQSTSATSLVNIYAATTPNAARTAAIGGVFTTTTVAASNLATQSPQSTSLTFMAPAKSVWIVFAKNTTSTNYNFFVDNLKLTETIPSAVENQHLNSNLKAWIVDRKLKVEFENLGNEITSVTLMNIAGQIVFSSRENLPNGLNTLQYSINQPSGIYILELKQGSKTAVIKLMI
jgi:hypothetical protein